MSDDDNMNDGGTEDENDTNPMVEWVVYVQPLYIDEEFYAELVWAWLNWVKWEVIEWEYLEGDDEANTLVGERSDVRHEIYGLGGEDTIYGNRHADYLDGGRKSDTIHGGDGADTILGGNGEDFLYGEDGADMIEGGRGDDELYGGAHNDTIIGGVHDDELHGGSGQDTFLFHHSDGEHNNDTIMDYEDGEIIDLSATGARSITLVDTDYFASVNQYQHIVEYTEGLGQNDQTHTLYIRSALVDDYRDIDFVFA